MLILEVQKKLDNGQTNYASTGTIAIVICLSYLFLQNAGELSESSIQTGDFVVGPLPTVLALQMLQQILHQALQPKKTIQEILEILA